MFHKAEKKETVLHITVYWFCLQADGTSFLIILHLTSCYHSWVIVFDLRDYDKVQRKLINIFKILFIIYVKMKEMKKETKMKGNKRGKKK